MDLGVNIFPIYNYWVLYWKFLLGDSYYYELEAYYGVNSNKLNLPEQTKQAQMLKEDHQNLFLSISENTDNGFP